MAYDRTLHAVVLFGGFGFSPFRFHLSNTTWAFQHGTWSRLASPTKPPASSSDGLAYDAADGELVLVDDSGTPTTTWVFR
jgi:hypothetical protein